MKDQGRSRAFVIVVWSVTALLLAAATVFGNVLLSGSSGCTVSVLLALAGWAMLASLADTLTPTARAGRLWPPLPPPGSSSPSC